MKLVIILNKEYIMTEKEFNLLPYDERLRLAELSQTDFRQYLIETNHATDEQIDALRKLGLSGGGLFTLSVNEAKKRIDEYVEKHKNEQFKELYKLINGDNNDYVNCWECGQDVHIDNATYDGNGWYCGC
jgi:hypothetical protein